MAPKWQQRAARTVRVRLDPEHPAFSASDDVTDALRDCALYLRTHVFPLLDRLIAGRVDYAQLVQLRDDAAEDDRRAALGAEEQLARLAHELLGFESFTERGVDRFDFRDCHVGNIRAALIRAFNLGRQSAGASPRDWP
jgi:hypothetical protein